MSSAGAGAGSGSDETTQRERDREALQQHQRQQEAQQAQAQEREELFALVDPVAAWILEAERPATRRLLLQENLLGRSGLGNGRSSGGGGMADEKMVAALASRLLQKGALLVFLRWLQDNGASSHDDLFITVLESLLK